MQDATWDRLLPGNGCRIGAGCGRRSRVTALLTADGVVSGRQLRLRLTAV